MDTSWEHLIRERNKKNNAILLVFKIVKTQNYSLNLLFDNYIGYRVIRELT